MKALFSLEDKLSTKAALTLLGCAAFAITGIGVLVLLKKVRWKRMRSQKQPAKGEFCLGWVERNHSWAVIRDTLMGSLRWSGPRKWAERHTKRGLEQRLIRLFELEGYGAEIIGWQNHNSKSPVWQRPILMGEKCEPPRFSGLILYDEQGRPLRDSQENYSSATGRNGSCKEDYFEEFAMSSLKDYFRVGQRWKESITQLP